ncbi:hypothetical protein [Secundilactobacillus folii]|uniref:Lipoprotein n=1 Tax=Secundilactobacillus folii TaxID=2678357 RepID=A0A7X2XXX7_9LACO|nr:hypothetical protein [Secundilactobacillus folii]MTV83125.1 hypothetical protein [Secundilactobacillus folii]
MKKLGLLISAALLSLVLAACGKPSLTVAHQQYTPSGMTAVIKGTTNQKKVQYQINGASAKTAKINNGAYAITLPAKPYKQTIKIKSANKTVTTTIAKSPAIMAYIRFKTAYNQTLMATALSKKDQATALGLQAQGAKLKQQQAKLQAQAKAAQAKLKSGDTSAATTLSRVSQEGTQLKTSAAQLKATQAKLAPALAVAKKQVAGKTIKADAKTGIYNLKSTKSATLRGNVDKDQLVGVTLMVPVSALKSTKAAKSFMTELAVLTSSVGANTKTVLNGFKNKANKKNSSQTTTSTIHSKGIDFDLGYSKTMLYIYVTHH